MSKEEAKILTIEEMTDDQWEAIAELAIKYVEQAVQDESDTYATKCVIQAFIDWLNSNNAAFAIEQPEQDIAGNTLH